MVLISVDCMRKRANKQNAPILVVYGYHADEKFAIDIGINLEEYGSEKATVKRYEGRADVPGKWGKPNLRKFIRKHSPIDYAIILHDSGPITDEIMKLQKKYPEQRFPSVSVQYYSKKKIPEDVENRIKNYCYSRPYVALSFFVPSTSAESKNYDRLNIEYLPHNITKDEGVKFLKGLIGKLEEI